ncbi:hypothetical protein RclHR1_21220005 [Rhizophagus clarus]|uniref:Uncharacterized protein n=1 Tax=Rhizophagus clarus TaxID=94130 RepID=A0A2Z6QT47_9GLOM|nr:hypothetical protein RclHR1_21220005 [Rhizophagus clarus]
MEELFYEKRDIRLQKCPHRIIYNYKDMKAEEGNWNWKNYNKDISEELKSTSIKLIPDRIRGIQFIKELNQHWNYNY